MGNSNFFEKVISSIKNNAINYKQLEYLKSQIWNDYKSPKVILGQIQAANNNLLNKVNALNEVEFQVFSQFGDDGIIAWLTTKLPLPNKTFVEFGVENYREANTRFLLINKYWSGLVIDGNNENIKQIRNEQIHTFYDLQPECAFITRDNINIIISTSRFDKDVGVLSVDIDGNDYWVWEAINSINPIIVIIEYNSLFGFEHPYTIPYQADFVRGTSMPFSFYGTSLLSACDLAYEKGYIFIGCNSAGNNAYFIRKDYMQHLPINSVTPQQGYVFASFTESWDNNRKPFRGAEKINSINGQKVINTRTMNQEILNADSIISLLKEYNKLPRI